MEIDHDLIHAYNGLLSSNCTIKYNLVAVKKKIWFVAHACIGRLQFSHYCAVMDSGD